MTSPKKTDESENWAEKIADSFGGSTDFVKKTFSFKDGGIVLVDWDIGKKDTDKKREVAKVVIYANEMGLNQEEVPIAHIKTSLEKLGISFDPKSIARRLKTDTGILTKNTGYWMINLQGKKDAEKHLSSRQDSLGYN